MAWLIQQEKLRESQAASERNAELEREVKEKNLFIGKLRQEGTLPLCPRWTATYENSRYSQ